MAALWKLSIVLLSVGMFITLSSSKETVSDYEEAVSDSVEVLIDSEDALIISEFEARAKPGWMPCDFTETREPSCYDCNTRLICKSKKKGGFLLPCITPGSTYCVNGQCVATPSDECAPGTTTLAVETTELPAAVEPTTTALDLDDH